MKKQNTYNAWKAKLSGEPIEGTDRIILSESKRSVLKHLAHEEGVKHQHNDVIVKCKDSTIWHVSQI